MQVCSTCDCDVVFQHSSYSGWHDPLLWNGGNEMQLGFVEVCDMLQSFRMQECSFFVGPGFSFFDLLSNSDLFLLILDRFWPQTQILLRRWCLGLRMMLCFFYWAECRLGRSLRPKSSYQSHSSNMFIMPLPACDLYTL